MEYKIEKPIVVYSSESPLKKPSIFFQKMFRDLRASGNLAKRLTIRDVSAQYRQTALGYCWAVLPPLVMSLTFIILNRANVIHVSALSIPYPIFLLTGTIFWQLFVDALNAPLRVLTANKQLLSKINFPKEALILSAIGQILFSFGIKVILLVGALILFQVPVKGTAPFILLPLIGLLAIGILCGIFLVPIGMLYQDIQQGLIIVTSALIFFTPVLFPQPEGGILKKIMELNPLSPFLLSCRSILYSGTFEHILESAAVLVVTMVLLFLGWIIYRISLPILIERMDA